MPPKSSKTQTTPDSGELLKMPYCLSTDQFSTFCSFPEKLNCMVHTGIRKLLGIAAKEIAMKLSYALHH